MPSPFPGMDPHLEHPRFSPDLHGGLVSFLKLELQQRLPEAYYAQAYERVWLEMTHRYVAPDVNIMREPRKRRARPRRSGQGGVAVAEPEVGYDAGPYRKRIRYGEDPIKPPLRRQQAEWAKTILKPASAGGGERVDRPPASEWTIPGGRNMEDSWTSQRSVWVSSAAAVSGCMPSSSSPRCPG